MSRIIRSGSRNLAIDDAHIHNLLHPRLKTIDWKAVTERAKKHPQELQECQDALLRVVVRDPPVEALQTIIRADPEALTSREDFSFEGNHMTVTPLALACNKADVSLDVVRTIIQEMVTPTGRSGRILKKRKISLSSSVFYKTGIEEPEFPLPLLQVFLEEFPASLFFGGVASQIVMSSTESADYWEKLNLVLMAITMGTTNENELNGNTFLVLHAFLAMVSGIGMFSERDSGLLDPHDTTMERVLDILKLIKTRVPEQFRTRDNDGSLPLHIVLQTKGNLEGTCLLVKYLVDIYPESARIPDGQGRLPLRIVLQSEGDVKRTSVLVQCLVDIHPEFVRIPDGQGWLPLHFALQSEGRSSLERTSVLVKYLVEVYPESVRILDGQGRLPLHFVLQSVDDVERTSLLVKYLVELYPESVRIPDGQGRLPLHLAIEHGYPSYLTILEADPTVVETPCPVTGLYPFQLTAAGFDMRKKRLCALTDEIAREKIHRTLLSPKERTKRTARKDRLRALLSETSSIDMSFTLLRLSPHVMNNLIAGTVAKEPWVHAEVQEDSRKQAEACTD